MLQVSSIFITIAESLSMAAVSSRPSPRYSFDQQSLVGLGIVAALSNQLPELRAPRIVVSPRSSSIPMLSAIRPGNEKVPTAAVEEELAEEAESYTCVISRHGAAEETKWEYFGIPWVARKSLSSPAPVSKDEFLSSCCLCKKNLHGLDIFMYRGEKAFCSAECRYQQMLNDETKESCVPEILKESSSPCSTSRLFLSGVVAA